MTLPLTQSPGMPAGVVVFLLVLLVAASLAMTAFWLWALIDAIRNPRLDESMRIVWVLVVVLLHVLGAILYFFLGRRPEPPV